MALTYTYADAYVAAKVTEEREARAIAEVGQMGPFPAPWSQRLGVLRAYVLTCIECASSPDDMWTTKLSAYRKEFEFALPQARAAQAAADKAAGQPATSSFFSCELVRG